MKLTGVLTGIDSDTFVDAAMRARRAPLKRLESRKLGYESRGQATKDLQSRLTSLRNAADGMTGLDSLRGVKATVSDDSVLGVTAGDKALEGAWSVEVNALAQAEKEVHDGLAGLDSLVGAGKFVYNYGGTTRTIHTTDTTTLQDLQNMINEDAGNPGVTASVLEYEVDADHNYHLTLTGQKTGASNSITIDAATDLTAFAADTFTETQTASNAQIRLDGYPAGSWIERETNTISDVIPDMSLSLKTTGSTTIAANTDTSKLKDKVQSLVDAYNGLVDALDDYTGYNQETGKSGILQGDAVVNGLLPQIRSELVGTPEGWDSAVDDISMVADIGLQFEKDGHLKLDTAKLDQALETNYDEVLQFIGADKRGVTDSTYMQFDGTSTNTQAGIYDVKVEFDGDVITAASYKLSSEADTEWRSASVEGSMIVGGVDTPEEGLALTAVSDGTAGVHTQTGQVTIQHGIASSIGGRLDNLLHETDGVLVKKQGQIEDAINMVENQMENMEGRLERIEQRLYDKYARMEATLARLESQKGAFEAVFSSLDSGDKKQ